ncbi:hypothetical protein QBC35DRAFT_371506 [Podospora australis]|uniref:F-box domain-containing protein n=1 Tax=Podospora australis TaxID=1536484 RepID=A0AAN7ALW7_9PEZI|nr:hypothetical protein QBC35DRAFT_371506 [Podospora australis]
MTILQLPPEIFHNILVFVDPEDLGTLPLTCRHFNDFISGNNALCRDMYLRYLDDPPTTNFNYTEELHDVVRLAKVCSSQQLFEPDNARAFILEELPFVHRVVTHLLANSVPPPPSPRDPAPQIIRTSRTETFNPSNNATVLNSYFSSNYLSRSAFFKQSTIFARLRQTNNVHPRDGFVIGDDATPPEHRQQSAKLHCLYGIADTLKDITNRRRYRYAAPVSSPARSIYGLACSKVYDLREYRRHGTAWGPFYGGDHGDGLGLRVDWEKTEAILLVIGANLHIKGLADFEGVENVWGRPFAGVWEKSYIPWTLGRLKLEREREEERLRGDVDEDELKKRQEKEELEKQDPYGVGGTWLRIVCFLDYSDFFLFNFPPANHPRNNAGPREAIDRGEATRLILMKVRVTEVEKATEPGDDPNWPVVHFEGISRALDSSWDENADSELIGTARMTKEGEVRWTTYSIYSGEERWKSEGFQLGGVKSARGVIGNWFDKDYNDRGPCGPTAFWKVADHEYSGDDTDMLLSNLLPLSKPPLPPSHVAYYYPISYAKQLSPFFTFKPSDCLFFASPAQFSLNLIQRACSYSPFS